MAVLDARIRQATICRPGHGETFCIIYVPVEDIKIVLMKYGQQIKDGLDGKEFPAGVQHEASVRIEIGIHFGWIWTGRSCTASERSGRGYI